MGLFSSTKKTYVSSVIYNLAGPPEDRPDYLKSVVLGNMITEKRFKPAETIQAALQGGSGIRLRSYHRWARTNYKQVGISNDRFYGKRVIAREPVAAVLTEKYGIQAAVDWIEVGPTDIAMWGRQWMREHMPLKEPTDTWRTDFIEATREAMIVFSDGTPPVVFKPLGYRDTGDWLYVSYSQSMQTNRWTTPKLFIYERGTGSPDLDSLMLAAPSVGQYLPFIPIRHENKFISTSYKSSLYSETKKAYKKALGGKLEDLLDKIKENDDLDEIDFAYIVFGASINTKDVAARRYIFRYFKYLAANQISNAAAFDAWAGNAPSVTQGIGEWLNWYHDQQAYPPGSPVTQPAPDRPALSSAPYNAVQISDRGPGQTNLNMEIGWNSMELFGGVGSGKAGAKRGDVWFTFAGAQEIILSAYTADEAENLKIDTIEMWHQVTDNTWEKLVIKGMAHVNHIYNGKSVTITAAQGLVDDDDSGFIVPLNYDVFREMSLVDSTQLATQSAYLVFNCYQIVKKKWYQKGWFKVFLFVAVIVITVVTGGAGAGSVGLLGANAAVGAALGFSGLAAVIAGAIGNMVAAMIVTKLITYASVEILGEKIGYIVAAIASMVVLNVGATLKSGGSMASMWSQMTNAQNLLNLTNSVGNAYTQMINQDTMSYVGKTQDALNDFREQSLKIQQNYAENIGYGSAMFDPLSLTGVDDTFFTEDSDTFLARTLLTGSDIAEMSKEMITNFVELSLSNPYMEQD